jgi:regulator of protease activity HflC (stomatin/prohibitin superfamily)
VIEIDAGKIGVKKLFGKVQQDILRSGLHFVNPLVTIIRMDVRTQNYTMSGIQDEGAQAGDDAIRVLTSDGLEVVIDLTVLFRLREIEAPRIVQEIGEDYVNKIVRPVTRTKIRDNAVYYQAVELYSTKRDEFQSKIYVSIDSVFKTRGLELEQLLVRNITLPASVKERQEAERKRVEAQGISDYQKIINATLTDKQLKYEMIKAYQGLVTSPNGKIIVMDGGTPIIIDGK